MKITEEWLEEKETCEEGIIWFADQKETDAIKVLDKLINQNRLDWGNWLICRVFNYDQRVKYAVFAAGQVLHLWADKYPKEAAIWKKWVDNGCLRKDANAAANAATNVAANAATYAAYAANAANAANAATYAANAANAAANATNVTNRKEMKLKILNYGMGLIK